MRTEEDIKNEYTRACLAAGDMQYRIKSMQEDLGLINEELKKLNIEAAELMEAKEGKHDQEHSKSN